MFGLFNKKKPQAEPPGTAQQIVPRIKHRNFQAAMDQIAAADPDSRALIEPFVADLLITYAFDLPEGFMMLRECDRRQLGLSVERMSVFRICLATRKDSRPSRPFRSPAPGGYPP